MRVAVRKQAPAHEEFANSKQYDERRKKSNQLGQEEALPSDPFSVSVNTERTRWCNATFQGELIEFTSFSSRLLAFNRFGILSFHFQLWVGTANSAGGTTPRLDYFIQYDYCAFIRAYIFSTAYFPQQIVQKAPSYRTVEVQ